MRSPSVSGVAALLAVVSIPFAARAQQTSPVFESHTLDSSVQIGYGVAVADVDGDKRPDVLLADKKQFVWYRNPGPTAINGPWQKHILAENLTAKDNVCIAAEDIDGDGKCEVAVGAEWNPGDTEKSGAVFYLIPAADRTMPWQPVRLHAEPTTHRMRWVRINGAKEGALPVHRDWGLVVAPLHGRGNKNGEGAGVKILLYAPPENLNDPAGEWRMETVSDSMHMTHNFDLSHSSANAPAAITIAGREGLFRYERKDAKWTENRLVSAPAIDGFRGAGEVRAGNLEGGRRFLAAVEPMHGTDLAVYSLESGLPKRMLLLQNLADGHALACGDLLGHGRDQIVVGYRGNPQQLKPVGIKIFTAADGAGEKWTESWIDENGMACEDLTLADLNGDGAIDIVASGRSTRNLKIYLNRGKAGTR
jgi:hypothetical protein